MLNLKTLGAIAVCAVIWILLPCRPVNAQPRDVTGRLNGEVNITFCAKVLSELEIELGEQKFLDFLQAAARAKSAGHRYAH